MSPAELLWLFAAFAEHAQYPAVKRQLVDTAWPRVGRAGSSAGCTGRSDQADRMPCVPRRGCSSQAALL
jgi:hypothetical protein